MFSNCLRVTRSLFLRNITCLSNFAQSYSRSLRACRFSFASDRLDRGKVASQQHPPPTFGLLFINEKYDLCHLIAPPMAEGRAYLVTEFKAPNIIKRYSEIAINLSKHCALVCHRLSSILNICISSFLTLVVHLSLHSFQTFSHTHF